jgi:hypothetical protein
LEVLRRESIAARHLYAGLCMDFALSKRAVLGKCGAHAWESAARIMMKKPAPA